MAKGAGGPKTPEGKAKAAKNLELGRWVKGWSGNPGGKPKGSRNRSTIIRQWLDCKAQDGAPGTKADQITRAQIRKAEAGDTPAFNAVMDSGFGKLKEVHEFSGIDGAPIETDNKNTNVNAPVTKETARAAYERILKEC